MKSGVIFGIFLIFPLANSHATDLGVGSSMQCEVVSKSKKITKDSRSPASDLGKLKAFKKARQVCNREYAGSYPVNFAKGSSSGKNWIQFDCQSCFTFSGNVPEIKQEPKTVTGKVPEEAWLSRVAEAR